LPETLLQAVLELLDELESVVIPHYSVAHYPTGQFSQLTSEGILRETSNATEIPRPARFGPGPELVVRKTARGIEGVANEDDYFPPIPLSDDDVRQYEVSLPALVEKIRKENGIGGTGFQNDRGLIALGQKTVDGFGIIYVYLSLPNGSEDAVVARCRRLAGSSGKRSVMLTPCVMALSPEARQILASNCLSTPSLMATAASGRLELNWHDLVATAARVTHETAKVGRPRAEAIDGEKVRKIRGDLKQQDFASRAGISVDVLQTAEIDGLATEATIKKICRGAKAIGLKIKPETLKKIVPQKPQK
jgi:DNA-binding transcriptional regulator YiaG